MIDSCPQPHSPQHSNTIIRPAPYSLNLSHQLRNLQSSAQSDSPVLSTEVKDHGGSFLIQFSAGFFLTVVRPAFSELSVGYSKSFGPINVSVAVPPALETDSNNLNVTSLHRFIVTSTDNGSESVLGNLSAHLHYTRSSLHIQGKARVPNQLSDQLPMTLAVWASEEFFLPLVSDIAAVKGNTHISVNQAVRNASSFNPGSNHSLSKKCIECSKALKNKFDLCPFCKNITHKQKKCSDSHKAKCRAIFRHSSRLLNSPTGSQSPTIAPQTDITPWRQTSDPAADSDDDDSEPEDMDDLSQDLQPALTPLISHHPAVPAPIRNTHSSTAQVQLHNSLLQLATLPPPSTDTSISPPPSIPPVSHPQQHLHQSDLNVSCRQPGRPAHTAAALESELLQRALNDAKVLLTIRDKELKDEKTRSSLLLTRVKILEEKINSILCVSQGTSATTSTPTPSLPTSPTPCCLAATEKLSLDITALRSQSNALQDTVLAVLARFPQPASDGESASVVTQQHSPTLATVPDDDLSHDWLSVTALAILTMSHDSSANSNDIIDSLINPGDATADTPDSSNNTEPDWSHVMALALQCVSQDSGPDHLSIIDSISSVCLSAVSDTRSSDPATYVSNMISQQTQTTSQNVHTNHGSTRRRNLLPHPGQSCDQGRIHGSKNINRGLFCSRNSHHLSFSLLQGSNKPNPALFSLKQLNC